MQNILVVDDEKDIINLLRLYLENESVCVFEAPDGEAAYALLLEQPIDLVVADIMMPKMDGYRLIKKIRQLMAIPIIVISAKNQVMDKILGLDLGADDYITKPFDPLEVAARVRTHLRRIKRATEAKDILVVGDLSLNFLEYVVVKKQETLPLTKTEFRILELFMESPGRVFTKEQLYEVGWQQEYETVEDNTIRVIINRLRNKVGEERIVNIRGLGYRLEKQ